MRSGFRAFAATGLLALAVAATPASAVQRIGFETTPSNGETAPDASVGTDFAALGVIFSDALYFRCGGGCPAPSDGIFVSGAFTRSPFSVTFNGTTDAFGFSNVNASSGTATAFGANGAVLETIAFADFPTSYNFSVTGIRSISFAGSPQFGVDDFVFADVTGAVPEPATWAMMLLGFGGMGVAMRRRKVAARVRFA